MAHFVLNNLDRDFDGLGYSHAPATAGDAAGIPEIALWCAVIEQAFVDVGRIVPNNASVERRGNEPEFEAAKRFLLRNGKDFYIVCGLAGVNPAVIRDGAVRIER
jgi:hypothetical protein